MRQVRLLSMSGSHVSLPCNTPDGVYWALCEEQGIETRVIGFGLFGIPTDLTASTRVDNNHIQVPHF
jgi:hypothetical protein